MALLTPATDPNFAWDIPGWTNQGATAPKGPDTLEGLPANNAPSYNGGFTGAGLSSMYAATMDVAAVGTSMGTLVTNVGYFALVNIPVAVTSANVAVGGISAGTTSHGYVFLTDVFGNTLAKTADKTSNLIGTTTGVAAWSASVTVGPGLYYMGIAVTTTGTPSYGGAAAAVGLQAGLTYAATAPYVFPRFVTATGLTLTTAPTSFTFVTASSTSVGAPFLGLLP